MIGRFGAIFAQGRDQCGPRSRPSCQQGGANLAAMRTVESGKRAFLVGRADDAPAGACGDRRDQPALVRHWRRATKGSGLVLRAYGALARSLCQKG